MEVEHRGLVGESSIEIAKVMCLSEPEVEKILKSKNVKSNPGKPIKRTVPCKTA